LDMVKITALYFINW